MKRNGQAAVRISKNGVRYVAASRVTLDSVLLRHQAGDSSERIQESFPVLSLTDVEGALAYYHAHRDEVDAYLADQQQEWDEAMARQAQGKDPLLKKLRAVKSPREQPIP